MKSGWEKVPGTGVEEQSAQTQVSSGAKFMKGGHYARMGSGVPEDECPAVPP